MSGIAQFDFSLPKKSLRFNIDGSSTYDGYIKMDDSIYSQQSYPSIFSSIGLIEDIQGGGYSYNTVTDFFLPRMDNIFNPNFTYLSKPTFFIKV